MFDAEGEADVLDTGRVQLDTASVPGAAAARRGRFVCRHRGLRQEIETCRTKLASAVNFRGFPHLPANDFVVAYAVPGEPGHDGTPLR